MKVVIGAGLTGLSVGLAYQAKGTRDFVILEAEALPGGLARSRAIDGWVFDRAGHFFHFLSQGVKELVSRYTSLVEVRRKSRVFWQGLQIPYPFQENLHSVPVEDRVAMVVAAIEASLESNRQVANFKDWILAEVGKEISDRFMLPYNSKIYATDLSTLLPQQGGRYIPSVHIGRIVQGAFNKGNSSENYNSVLFYPSQGGIGSVAAAFSAHLHQNIAYGMRVVRIDTKSKTISCDNGCSLQYDGTLISTIPLPELVHAVHPILRRTRKLVEHLKATVILCLSIGVEGHLATDTHWYYVSEPEYPYYRIGSLSNVSSCTAPQGCSSLWAEIAFPPGTILDAERISEYRKQTLDAVQRMGLLGADARIRFVDHDLIPYGYVLYTREREEVLACILATLRECGIVSVGRYGEWKYDSMEGAISDGLSFISAEKQ